MIDIKWYGPRLHVTTPVTIDGKKCTHIARRGPCESLDDFQKGWHYYSDGESVYSVPGDKSCATCYFGSLDYWKASMGDNCFKCGEHKGPYPEHAWNDEIKARLPYHRGCANIFHSFRG